MKRIIDANLNRATEALRVLEEIARFYFNDEKNSSILKNIRHQLSISLDEDYENLLKSRDTQNDIGIYISNPTERKDIFTVFKANFKRLQQALRTLGEYAPLVNKELSVYEKLRYESYTLEKIMFEKLSQKVNKYRLMDKKLYLVTDSSKFSTEDEFLNAVASALKGGVQIIQLREKTANAKIIINLGRKVRELCSLYNALFIINDRIDIAQIIDADGVHIGQDDVDIEYAREILGENKIIGLSTHSPEQAIDAVNRGADYIGVGPVFTTPTKPGRQSVGLEYVEWASKNIDIPWFAIGGIDLENINDVINSGASRIAVVRAIINAGNPDIAVQNFKQALDCDFITR
ncbi:MAG: thiamine phosphate synthase [Candidatus Gastranaerophilales bacterium]|nr:thiamine phosphate synthase [Candidatus Gastranaerophilales bacterium]